MIAIKSKSDFVEGCENIKYIDKYTETQKNYIEFFDNRIKLGKSVVMSSAERRWGKTTVLNEIGFIYQSLGYEVYLITQIPLAIDHIATKYINDELNMYGLNRNAIAIIDEYEDCDRFRMILHKLEAMKIPYVGFAKYNKKENVNV